MDDYDSLQVKIVEGYSHRWGHTRGCGAFEFKAEPTVPSNDQEIEFGTGVCSPEETLFRSGTKPRRDHVKRKAFP